MADTYTNKAGKQIVAYIYGSETDKAPDWFAGNFYSRRPVNGDLVILDPETKKCVSVIPDSGFFEESHKLVTAKPPVPPAK
jgi:hypothetical protein